MAVSDRGYSQEDSSPRKQSRGESMRAPGSGKVSIPLGGRDNRSAAHHADQMQAWVGGGVQKEHEYEKAQTKAPKGNRSRMSRNRV